MHKITLLFISMLFLVKISYSQNTAPDFTATDIFGNQHSLYADYLNQGKTVLIDFSTTWCGPCWGLHRSATLEEVYHVLGPEGTNQIQILFIESDSITTVANLYGQGGYPNTLGNWVEGTPYPIIDQGGADIAALYGVDGFPTVLLICPDGNIFGDIGFMTNGFMNFVNVYEITFNCLPISNHSNDLKAVFHKGNKNSCNFVDQQVFIHNFGTESIPNFDYKIYRNGELYKTESYSAALQSKKIATLELKDLELDLTNDTTVFKVVLPDDEDNSNNELSFKIANIVPLSTQNIDITWQLDDFAGEDNSQFKIFDNDNNEIYASGPLPSNSLFEMNVELPNTGCHKVVLLDDFGDGVEGKFMITDSQNDTVYFDQLPPPFKALTLHFSADKIVGANEKPNNIVKINILPNVTNSNATLEVEAKLTLNNVKIELVNLLGKTVANIYNGDIKAGKNEFFINLAKLPSAQYFVKTTTQHGVVVEKVVKL